jgi:TolB-like protein/Flp pilus assembly protein TadD
MSGFFEEVQRRKVYRVAVAYVVAAGGIIQLASATFPAWELPNWALRFVIVVVLLGFPLALIFAWVFDVTPEGIQRTSQPEFVRPTHRKRNIAILCVAGVLISAVAGFFVLPRASARKVDKSIAVLPFENLSDDKENAYFADGIQDDILTNLSRIGDLKVVSRTSVMGYRGKPGSVREIGKALGVSTILEGTVRKAGNRVRVVVQLINTANDEHLWAQEYERDVTDVFAIQTDLAQNIANELQAKLSPSEKAQLLRKPTENGEAYLAFVQAHDLHGHVENVEDLKDAERLYERALQLDPNFALAHAAFSRLESWIFHTFDPTPARREKARSLANRALAVQPDLPEAHLALGFSYYYGDNNFEAALREFEIAQKGLPNDPEVYLALGAIQRRQGRWAESDASLEKSAELNPKHSWALQNLAMNYQMERDFAKTEQSLNRALAIDPQSAALIGMKVQAEIAARGDFGGVEAALATIAQMPDGAEKAYYVCDKVGSVRLLQRRYADALKTAEAISDEALKFKAESLGAKYIIIGHAKRGLGDDAGAREAFAKLKDLASQLLPVKTSEPDARMGLAIAHALLGEKEAALAEGERAMQLLPVSKDAFHGPDILQGMAQVCAIVGEKDRALQILDELSRIPSPQTAALLKLNPIWDPIRGDPRFEQLIAKYSAKT